MKRGELVFLVAIIIVMQGISGFSAVHEPRHEKMILILNGTTNLPEDIRIIKRYTHINAILAEVPAKYSSEGIPGVLSMAPVIRIRAIPFAKNSLLQEYSGRHINIIHADRLWSRNITGESIVIAIMDTGIDPNHEALSPYQDGNFSAKVIGWYDAVNGRTEPYDDNGHGTACASLIAGNSENYKGVAPDAKLVAVKILDKNGGGTSDTFMDAVDWIIAHKDIYNISVVSISLGSNETSDGNDPLSLAVDRMVSMGLVVILAAGNSGPSLGTVVTPGTSRWGITVGATISSGFGEVVASFSGRGPTSDGRIKPDVVAPGTFLDAALAGTQNEYEKISGTSAATPLVAGLAALILQYHPELTPFDVKNILMMATIPLSDTSPNNQEGYGLVQADYVYSLLSNEYYNFTHREESITPGIKNGILLKVSSNKTKILTIGAVVGCSWHVRIMSARIPEGIASSIYHIPDDSNTSSPLLKTALSTSTRTSIEIPPGNWTITISVGESLSFTTTLVLQPGTTGVTEFDLILDIMRSPTVIIICIAALAAGMVIGYIRKKPVIIRENDSTIYI